MYEEQVLYFFYKIDNEFLARTDDVGFVHYILTVYSCDVTRVFYGNIMNSF